MFFNPKPTNISFLPVWLGFLLMASCTVVKQFPKNNPFVYQTNINVKGNVSRDEEKRLETALQNYWDDSLKVPTVVKYGVRTIIKNPYVFDSSDVTISIAFMQSYLNSQGYYNTTINDSIWYTTKKSQVRANILMDISLGKSLTVDSLNFAFANPELAKIADGYKKESLLKTGKPYNKQNIAVELERLVTLFRKNGYYKINRENLVAVVDTTDVSLLTITLDPFEQARLLAEAAEKRRVNPTVDVVITERDTTSKFFKYYVGDVYYYPQSRINDIADSLMKQPYKIVYSRNNKTSKLNKPFIHFRPLSEHTYLRNDSLYNEERYFKTISAFSQLGTWSQVDVRTEETFDTLQVKPAVTDSLTGQATDSVKMLDFHFFLTPNQKYSLSTDLEISRNSGTILNGNLLGIANNITLRNRNVWKEAIQASTVVRNGIELSLANNTPLQTFQSSISHTLSIPRLYFPYGKRALKKYDAYKTLVNFAASYTERKAFFRLRSLVGSWGYETKKRNHTILYKPINVELYTLDTLQGLIDAFTKNPFLRTAFNTGYVVSQTFTYNVTFAGRNPAVSNNFRFSAEEAGGLFGLFRGLDDKLYRYLKGEIELKKVRNFNKTSLAFRLFGGIGYNYGSGATFGQSLPFFKQFFSGGPNSMRAWSLRQLGLGSSLLSDTSTSFRDRFGDVQLEANIEYRFPVANFSAVKIGSAVFADIGNIWNLKMNESNPNSMLEWNRFARDIAVGVGTGLRLDFSYFLIRLDFAYKVKDPARIKNNGWVNIADFEWRNKEFEISSPDGVVLKRNNYALQLGIGLPF